MVDWLKLNSKLGEMTTSLNKTQKTLEAALEKTAPMAKHLSMKQTHRLRTPLERELQLELYKSDLRRMIESLLVKQEQQLNKEKDYLNCLADMKEAEVADLQEMKRDAKIRSKHLLEKLEELESITTQLRYYSAV